MAGKNVRKKLPKEKSFLPDEIVTNILIRLPVKSLMRCVLVCRSWGDIISARDFVDSHFKTSIPLILPSIPKKHPSLDFFALDQWWEFAKTRLTIHRFPNYKGLFPDSYHIRFSHAGLIAIVRYYSPELEFYILNPARSSDECVKITICDQFPESDICGVYYHPLLNEYCCLLKIKEFSSSLPRPNRPKPKPIQYKLLNLGSNPSLKTISNLSSYKLKDENASPLFINNCFYWMLKSDQDDEYTGRNDILEFDIISEEFSELPCPVPLNTACMAHQTQLLNSNHGVLSLVLVLPNTITIWILKNRVEQLWTSTEYAVSIEVCHSYKAVGMIALVDGTLSFHHNRRLFLCNLKDGIVKNYPKRKYSGSVSFISHQMSLASLKNCKSALYINKGLEVLEMPKQKLECAGGEKNGCISRNDVQILELTQKNSDLKNQFQWFCEEIQELAARGAARDPENATFRAFMTRFSEDKGTSGASSSGD